MTSVPPFVAALLSFAEAIWLFTLCSCSAVFDWAAVSDPRSWVSCWAAADWGVALAIAACSSWISWSYLFTCAVNAAACVSSPARALDPLDTSADVTKTTSWSATALANASAARGEEPVAVICTRLVAMGAAVTLAWAAWNVI